MAPKFTLQTVLDVRHSKVESLELELATLMQERQEKENHLNSMINAQEKLYKDFHLHMSGDVDLFIVSHLRSNINMLSDQIANTRLEIIELDNRVEEKRLELVAAKQSEESLNILKGKELQRFLDGENEKEKRMQDDLYISRSYKGRQTEARP
jgi:flagellar export protein FliJ